MADAIVSLVLEQLIIFAAEELKQQGKLRTCKVILGYVISVVISGDIKLTKELCDVIEDYSLVNFSTLDIQDKESVAKLVKLIDKSNGYIFAGMDASAVEFSKIAVRDVDWDYYRYPSFHLLSIL
ncbi:hypothetical protein WN943_006045 [Citrus x changshan-huyou]